MEAILCAFLASNRFLQNAVLICEQASTSGRIDSGIESIDPHYRIIGYVSADTAANVNFSHHHYVESIDKNDLAFVKKKCRFRNCDCFSRQLGLLVNCISN
jgi:hypothetical protein